MMGFDEGDRVRIDIPDTMDPDYNQFHGDVGEIVSVIEDDAGEYSGDPRDSYLFEVRMESGELEHFRWRDIRPARKE